MADRICILLRHGDYHQLADTPNAHQPYGLNHRGRDQAGQAWRMSAARVHR
jgi:2,3-bisphosphoglycerate-dependent phosphoglycerate mutase